MFVKNFLRRINPLLGVFLILITACTPVTKQLIPITADDEFTIYLPLLQNGNAIVLPPAPAYPLVHIPFKPTNDFFKDNFTDMAVFWFGKVEINTNYYDVRIGYGNDSLFVYFAAFDRLLWYDSTPTAAELPNWDTISLFISPSGANQLITNQSLKFVGSLAPFELPRDQFQAAYRWNGSQWERGNHAFTTIPGWRGEAMNDPNDDRGWTMGFKIPYSTFGVGQTPAVNTTWRMAILAHDRDYLDNSNISPQSWPAGINQNDASNWGTLSFGLLPEGSITGNREGTIVIREGLNGSIVQDASPGGFTVCGDQMNFWTQWGTRIYTPTDNYTANIQNQRDVADWPCFSKYFIAFPLGSIPADKTILRATLKLHLYGNSGRWGDPVFQPYRSLIQVSTTQTGWNESSLHWNNAPALLENISQNWVEPLETFPGWPGVPYEWDVSTALRKAIQDNQNILSLGLYSADGPYHSGKYFSTSEVEEWNATARPTLLIEYGTP